MSGNIRINPELIAQARNQIANLRDRALAENAAISKEYGILAETMEGETLRASVEFQNTASQIIARVDETIAHLEVLMAEYSQRADEIDGTGARRALNV